MDELRNPAADAVATLPAPGVAWGLVRDGVLVAHGGEGVIDVPGAFADEKTGTGSDGDRAPGGHGGSHGAGTGDGSANVPTCDTVYRIASMTKSFTCAAVLSLRDEGALELDRPVTEYAPEFASLHGPGDSPRITLRHLMSMSAGMATDDPWADRHLDIAPDQLDAVVARGVEFAIATGSGFEYSNLGFGIIGRVVARATGSRVRDHVDERLLRPLGMDSTTWVEPVGRRWARPHRVRDGALVAEGSEPLGDGEIAPMGGLWTTVSDLARWVGWLDAANTGMNTASSTTVATTAADRWLSTASRREMQRIQNYSGRSRVAGRKAPSGYGFGIRQFDDPEIGMIVGHSGGLPGYGSNMRWVAGRGVGVIALSNVTYAPMAELTMTMIANLHESGLIPSAAPPEAELLTDRVTRLVHLLNGWDDATAAALFADNVDPDESFARRAAAAERLLEEHGVLEVIEVRATSRTSGRVRARGTTSGHNVVIELTVAPTGGIQSYELR